MPTISVPDYAGGSIVNLLAEVESRFGGSALNPRLHGPLGDHIPVADGYVIVVFDGLGSHQVDPRNAPVLADARKADLDAPFPATTTVSLASIATGMTPRQHGLLGYQLWVPEVDTVVNTIKWTTLWGTPVSYDTRRLLPRPNLWERLAQLGVESFTVQPANFDRSPLSLALYRSCLFEPAARTEDLVAGTLRVAGPGRLVVTYVPHIDFAAHVYGQKSAEYAEALDLVSRVWSELGARLPTRTALLGTADHGHVDFPARSQSKISRADHDGRVFYGDGRAMFVKGEAADLAETLPATWVPIDDARHWWGPGNSHPRFDERAPDGVLLADDDALLLHRFSDDRMIGNHGAMTTAEQKVPLLIRS